MPFEENTFFQLNKITEPILMNVSSAGAATGQGNKNSIPVNVSTILYFRLQVHFIEKDLAKRRMWQVFFNLP